MHSNVIAANMRAMLPTVQAHGYAADAIAGVVQSCLDEVSHVGSEYRQNETDAQLCAPNSRHLQRVFAVYGRKLG